MGTELIICDHVYCLFYKLQNATFPPFLYCSKKRSVEMSSLGVTDTALQFRPSQKYLHRKHSIKFSKFENTGLASQYPTRLYAGRCGASGALECWLYPEVGYWLQTMFFRKILNNYRCRAQIMMILNTGTWHCIAIVCTWGTDVFVLPLTTLESWFAKCLRVCYFGVSLEVVL
jgi:hypothetical protein